MELEITEDWIKERIKLDHDNLDDVKSLALPGTYHEKITRLGFSLQNFTRIQHLDLSKNNLITLKGIEHLSVLEQLNLYYNKINDLKEIFRLRKNQNLRDIDLRLNPVTGNEPDYRLFIAHMLPLLRRLDDRPVRDSERRAAMMHFANEGEGMFGDDSIAPPSETKSEKQKSRQPRVEYVKNLVKKPTVIDGEDTVTDVIDFVDKGFTNQPTSNKNKKPTTQMHTKDELLKLVREEEKVVGRFNKPKDRNRIESEETNLKFTDEDEAYSQFKGVAHFTPHPGSDDLPPTVNQETASTITNMSSSNDFQELPEGKRLSFGESTTTQEVSRRKNLTQIKLVESILDLVDRYWNGSKSLHYHQKFQSLVQKPLDCYEKELLSAREVQIKVLQDKISTQQQEVAALHQQLHDVAKKSSQASSKLDELASTTKELEATKHRLHATNSDNKLLRTKVLEMESMVKQEKQKPNVGQSERIVELENERKDLIQQVASMKRNAEQFERLNQLTEMLQDSHRSLVTTNEHLLAELDDSRGRHQSEIEQLKWSYDQLRSTTKLTNGHLTSNGEF
uniref:centrosomal protein of 72 kDa-like n=1 Tax=Ciona intestinalis TaxID=7719 RepID=UPI000052116F|nr:centrosomal protein of 72 kDa-like [Ciona intestinalis]|eukprot:XP_002131853.1 centrosomal protein of 72 kDa-like [Ciona intestinalis]